MRWILFLALLLALPAQALEAEITCTLPTRDVNGNPANVLGVRFYNNGTLIADEPACRAVVDLPYSTGYSIRTAAYNAQGEAVWSPASNGVTDAPPPPPLGVPERQSEAPVVTAIVVTVGDGDEEEAPSSKPVLWAIDPDAVDYNVDNIRTTGGNTYSEMTDEADATLGANVIKIHMERPVDDGSFGFSLNASRIPRLSIAATDKLHFRYLLRFGEIDESFWLGAGGQGFVLKAWDNRRAGEDNTARIITTHQPAPYAFETYDWKRGRVWTSLYPSGGATYIVLPLEGAGATEYPGTQQTPSTIFHSGVWGWCEIGISGDGSVKYWWAPWDGSGTEYTEGSPKVNTGTGQHSYDFATEFGTYARQDWDFGYQNHSDPPGGRDLFIGPAGLVIHSDFIGPGPVTSEN